MKAVDLENQEDFNVLDWSLMSFKREKKSDKRIEETTDEAKRSSQNKRKSKDMLDGDMVNPIFI
jgi:hypothetical protein